MTSARRQMSVRLKFLSFFGVIGAVTLGGLFFSLHGQAERLNRDFGIETLQGDIGVLDELYLGAVVREGWNQFMSVRLTSDGFETRPTVYDLQNNVGERVLNNRELYRNYFWHAPQFETDDYVIIAAFDDMAFWQKGQVIVNVRVQDKATGDVRMANVEPNGGIETSNDWVNGSFLIENDGAIYYIVRFGDEDLGVYSFDVQAMTMEFEFQTSISYSDDSWSTIFATDHGIHVQVSTWIESEDEQTLYVLDFEEQGIRQLDFELPWIDDWAGIGRRGHYVFYVNNWDEEAQLERELLIVANMQTGEVEAHPIERGVNEFQELYGTTGIQRWADDFEIVDNYLILNTHMRATNGRFQSPLTQFIAVYDLERKEIVYGGRLILRRDQGLIRHWDKILGFNILHHD